MKIVNIRDQKAYKKFIYYKRLYLLEKVPNMKKQKYEMLEVKKSLLMKTLTTLKTERETVKKRYSELEKLYENIIKERLHLEKQYSELGDAITMHEYQIKKIG